jgi:hypothetical protein
MVLVYLGIIGQHKIIECLGVKTLHSESIFWSVCISSAKLRQSALRIMDNHFYFSDDNQSCVFNYSVLYLLLTEPYRASLIADAV